MWSEPAAAALSTAAAIAGRRGAAEPRGQAAGRSSGPKGIAGMRGRRPAGWAGPCTAGGTPLAHWRLPGSAGILEGRRAGRCSERWPSAVRVHQDASTTTATRVSGAPIAATTDADLWDGRRGGEAGRRGGGARRLASDKHVSIARPGDSQGWQAATGASGASGASGAGLPPQGTEACARACAAEPAIIKTGYASSASTSSTMPNTMTTSRGDVEHTKQ